MTTDPSARTPRATPSARLAPRPALRFPPRMARRQTITLVGQRPSLLRIGRILTDGETEYKVLDGHSRFGRRWWFLTNVSNPELEGFQWFHEPDLYELAYVIDKPKRET